MRKRVVRRTSLWQRSWPRAVSELFAESKRVDNLLVIGRRIARAKIVPPDVAQLQARIAALEDILQAIAIGSRPRGRWLDMFDTAIDGYNSEDVAPPDPNAYWEEYSEEEQRAWLDTVADLCETALEGGN